MAPDVKTHLEQSHDRYVRSVEVAEADRVEFVAAVRTARESGATNQEIGDVLGVTRQRVSQLLRKEVR